MTPFRKNFRLGLLMASSFAAGVAVTFCVAVVGAGARRGGVLTACGFSYALLISAILVKVDNSYRQIDKSGRPFLLFKRFGTIAYVSLATYVTSSAFYRGEYFPFAASLVGLVLAVAWFHAAILAQNVTLENAVQGAAQDPTPLAVGMVALLFAYAFLWYLLRFRRSMMMSSGILAIVASLLTVRAAKGRQPT